MDRILELLALAVSGEITAEQQSELTQLLSENIGTADARADGLPDVPDDQLAEVQAQLREAFDALAGSDAPVLDVLGAIADATDAITAEDAERTEAAEAAQRAIDTLA